MRINKSSVVLFLIMAIFNASGVAQHCLDCGQGGSGILRISRDTVILSGNYEFQRFQIDSGVHVKVKGTQTLMIKCKEDLSIYGILDASGGNGEHGLNNLTMVNGGKGCAGGGNGGSGIYNSGNGIVPGNNGSGPGYGYGGTGGSGSGGGYASTGKGCNLPGGNSYGDTLLTQIEGGSGGGSGMALPGGISGGGGAGGGILILTSCSNIIIGSNGEIRCKGGNGGNGNQRAYPGGGGSGGSIYLSGKEVEINGIISVKGGTGGQSFIHSPCSYTNDGADGRIRIDSRIVKMRGSIFPSAYFHEYFSAGIKRTVNPKCPGSATGFIKTRVSGGKSPYTFNWSNGRTGDQIDDIPAGTYTVTITDGNGCSFTDQATLTDPAPIVPEVITYPPSCETLNDGKLLFKASGGTPYPYQKSLFTTLWSNASSHGIMFDVTVNTPLRFKSISLNLPSPTPQTISIYFKTGPMAGAENDPSQWQLYATTQVTGMGNDEETPLDLSILPKLTPGRYAFYIYNQNHPINCVSSPVIGNTFNFDHLLTVHEGQGRNKSGNAFSASVKGPMNLAGKINYLVEQENNFPYNFIVDTVNAAIQLNRPSGVQTYTVTDVFGCSVKNNISIPAAAKMNITTPVTRSPKCSNSTDGSITISAVPSINELFCATPVPKEIPSNGIFIGFMLNNTIKLNGIDLYSNQSGQVELYLKQGTYTGSEFNASDWTSLGSYTVNPTGISGLSAILLNTQQTLSPGAWSLYAYSNNGLIKNLDSACSFENPNVIYLQSVATSGSSGAFSTTLKSHARFAGTLRFYSGNHNLNYQWSNGASSSSISQLPGGIYTVNITQDNACSVIKTIPLNSPDPIVIQKNITPETEQEGNGSIQVNITGGTAPYYVHWINNGQTGASLYNIPAGAYPVFVADASGCLKTDTLYVTSIANPIVSEGTLEVAPNPSAGQFLIIQPVKGMEGCRLRIFDNSGRLSYETETSISRLMTNGLNLSGLADGHYFMQVNDDDQLFHARIFIIR